MSDFTLGIVGHSSEKFTIYTEPLARWAIVEAIEQYKPDFICSGRSPMGGVDIFAEEIAAELGIRTIIFAPTINTWHGKGGFMERNIDIANNSSLVVCVVISPKALPHGVKDWGNGSCYHCKNRNPPHIKSGGCWTAWRCARREWKIVG